MEAILLAAGEGTRLAPITETRPKAMVPVLCKPLLWWHLNALLSAGFEEVVVVVGYMKEKIVEYIKQAGFGSRVKLVDQGTLLGTGDAVVKAAEHIGYGEDVVVAYADIFMSNWRLYEELAKLSGYYVVGAHAANPRDYGVLYVEDLYLKKIVEKPERAESMLVNMGVYRLNTTDILENRDVELSPRGEIEFTDIVTRIAEKKPIKVYTYSGEWIDVGKPWHVIEANKIALKSIRHEIKGEVMEPVYIEAPVYVGEKSKIYPFTTIQGPVYIDERVEVGPSAYIRPWSVICSGSRIGFAVEVKESVIFENVHASHLTYIGDSVICENTNLGAGTILANLRFDKATVKMRIKDRVEDTGRKKLGAIVGANVEIGVNVSTMPGVKIGSGSWIMPGTIVYRDVPPNTIYPAKQYGDVRRG
ncbi:MAG: bifunctional sugar-1-phosphate nucleotidylyltransferase/acetyltransferase [Desulfurococcaceae archaeon]